MVTEAQVERACRAHTPQFENMDEDIQKYARQVMRSALQAAFCGPEIPQDPTEAMVNAGIWADRECEGDKRAAVINTWHAMYAAAIVSQ